MLCVGDNSLRFLRQRSNEQTLSGTSTTDCPKMDHDDQKAYFSRQSSENIYDEPLIVLDIGHTEDFPHSSALNIPVMNVFHGPSPHQEPLTSGLTKHVHTLFPRLESVWRFMNVS